MVFKKGDILYPHTVGLLSAYSIERVFCKVKRVWGGAVFLYSDCKILVF